MHFSCGLYPSRQFPEKHLHLSVINYHPNLIMKQLSLLAILLCLVTGFAKAATVSGTVTNAATSSPAASQRVYIYDSLVAYNDSTLTNSSGVYSFTLPSAVK